MLYEALNHAGVASAWRGGGGVVEMLVEPSSVRRSGYIPLLDESVLGLRGIAVRVAANDYRHRKEGHEPVLFGDHDLQPAAGVF